jgi:hypothetical protein
MSWQRTILAWFVGIFVFCVLVILIEERRKQRGSAIRFHRAPHHSTRRNGTEALP